jgi:exopolysaccharide biosynthesis polyprenyl glycosylphosphotransferase
MTYNTERQADPESVVVHAIGPFKGKFARFEEQVVSKLQSYRVPFSERRVLLALVDSVLVLVAVWAAHLLWESAGHQRSALVSLQDYWHWFPLALGGWWILAPLNDLYDIPSSCDKGASILRVVTVGVLGLLAFLVIDWLIPAVLPLGRFSFALFSIVFLIICWRFAYASLSRFITAPQRILILGVEKREQAIAQLLQQGSPLNYHVLGYADTVRPSPGVNPAGLSVLGHASDLLRLVDQLRVDEVVVATNNEVTEELFQLLVACQAHGVQVSYLPNLYEKLYRRIPVRDINPAWALYAMQGQPIFNRLRLSSKRILDLVFIFLSLPLLGLLIPFLALAVRLDSPGPVFYRQLRSGRAGKTFSIIKFRTMVVDAEKDGRAVWATENDPRITRVGSFLRKTRLDELPQLINILKGDMSLVGPRPERPEFIEELQQAIPFYRVRLLVKPGLTGWAQIHYDYGNSVEDALIKLQYDFYYIRYWSLWLDLYTLFKTVYVVLKFKGM